MSLFIIFRARFVFLFPNLGLLLPPVSLVRLRPRPRNLLIKFCTDSGSCLDTISPKLVSGELRSVISVRILPPVRNVSRPTALAPLHKRGRSSRKRQLKSKTASRLFRWYTSNRCIVINILLQMPTPRYIDYHCNYYENEASL